MKKLLVCFAAGSFGALIISLLIWLAGDLGISKKFGISIKPALTAYWIYPRIVWGGIWGVFYTLPVLKSKLFVKGVLLSLLPSAAQLFYFFPFKGHQGFGGIELGILTPIWVIGFNMIWGLVTAATIRWSR